jgi:Na+-transporting NADH:ubiquinone oxidoreductase subunit C
MNKNSPFYVIGFMIVICIVFGSAIATVYRLTVPITMRNELLNRNRAIANAFGLSVAGSSAAAYEEAVRRAIDRATITVAGVKQDVYIGKEAPRNVGFVFRGIGFWDVISGIIVLSPDLSTIVGIHFLEQHETPGLGARIEEPWFYRQFKGKTLAWDNPIERRIIIGEGSKNLTNHVDAITGATQTSMALMRMLNDGLEAFRNAYKAGKRNSDASELSVEGGIAWR